MWSINSITLIRSRTDNWLKTFEVMVVISDADLQTANTSTVWKKIQQKR